MQRVTNCILLKDNQALSLKKPSRGWWVAPGGKMEVGESIRESVKREFYEETGLKLIDPELKGIFTIVVEEENEVIDEWMMFTFFSTQFTGELLENSPEGLLAWQPIQSLQQLPMAPGDYFIFDHILQNKEIMYGTFVYTKEFKLLDYRLDSNLNNDKTNI
ncbi:8-oxo-dGTP diphosphatase [Evansella sp. AB-P1]|uniref:NUDIX hydrolase n=1 Tax=Evansella sp. AB-P1 TaxID=3037653 RepID=UPI00241E64AE|nr:8-oxo-dGTP diphosphatase [Evansella sp. AB-P1]MDG5786606.1 8-oxo-dGTP diphosphatase [Evansella sp. AB-P1]